MNTKTRILYKAIELFNELGARKVSTNHIAEASLLPFVSVSFFSIKFRKQAATLFKMAACLILSIYSKINTLLLL
uniref:HTH tetR-type domain-containing protein n=1 Tax=Halalkalibacterium halodurans TaxID=86665 RepID=A0A0M0KFY1_ALKHA